VIANYEILPYWMVNIIALVLPWLEFWIGLFLIAGIFVRSCAIIQIGLLLIFILAIGLNIARGVNFYCGCFPDDKLASGMNYPHILLNAFLVCMALILYILEKRRFRERCF
jgi:hypothetical protein